jgi:hypothetical protein
LVGIIFLSTGAESTIINGTVQKDAGLPLAGVIEIAYPDAASMLEEP